MKERFYCCYKCNGVLVTHHYIYFDITLIIASVDFIFNILVLKICVLFFKCAF